LVQRPIDAPQAVGLALGSGSARGLAHIGVLKALAEAGIEVTVVAGTSIGALIGAVYASGRLAGLAEEFLAYDWKSVAALLDPIFPRSGLIDGQKVASFVRAHVDEKNIENLPIAFAAVATDILTGTETVMRSGDLIEAVRASIAVPGILTPVRSNGRIFVDGGLVNPVPVSVARAMGATQVIAVDLNHDIVEGRRSRRHSPPEARGYDVAIEHILAGLRARQNPALRQFDGWLHKDRLPGMFDVLLASLSIMQRGITEARLKQDKPDVLIRPPLGEVRFMEFDRAEEIIETGYRSAIEQLATWSR